MAKHTWDGCLGDHRFDYKLIGTFVREDPQTGDAYTIGVYECKVCGARRQEKLDPVKFPIKKAGDKNGL